MKFRILRFKKLRSTNDTAIRMVKSSNLNYGMIIADSQSNGRGQYGRKWISFKGNLFVSFFYVYKSLNFFQKFFSIVSQYFFLKFFY